MTVRDDIYAAISTLVPGAHVYRDHAPDTLQARPYITFVGVGGQAVNFLDAATRPSKKHQRFQINVWAVSREQASALSHQVEDAMRTINAYVEGAPVDTDETDLGIYGTRQDFSIWFDDAYIAPSVGEESLDFGSSENSQYIPVLFI